MDYEICAINNRFIGRFNAIVCHMCDIPAFYTTLSGASISRQKVACLAIDEKRVCLHAGLEQN